MLSQIDLLCEGDRRIRWAVILCRAVKRWSPGTEPSKKEQMLLKRLSRTRKLFAFLRLHRHEIFDDAFQAELESMYRDTGAGEPPVPPALLCMAVLLQAYARTSDAEAVELSLVDARWAMVLDNLTSEEPAFSQGALQSFRERLIRHDMDQRVLERTVEYARQTKEFDWKKLPKDLRLAVDSRPLAGAGRVEDTFNLLGHGARKLVEMAAKLLQRTPEEICRQAGAPLFTHKSVKAALDVNWNEPEQRDEALEILASQVTAVHEWVQREALEFEAPLKPYIEAVAQVWRQDLEEREGGGISIRRGVAEDRRISIEDPDMRHGRKSKTKRFNGFKQHIASDLDSKLIVACAITPANRPEEEAAPELAAAVARQGLTIGELSVDRAYVNSELVEQVRASGGEILCKPWALRNSTNLFSKAEFKINIRDRTITCPAGEVEHFEPGETVEFDPEACGRCAMRGQCTKAASGRGRQVTIAEDEQLQQRLRKLAASPTGRERLRARTGIEHRLAHIAARQGPRARYRGSRANLFDLRRMAIIQNLETVHRVSGQAKKAA